MWVISHMNVSCHIWMRPVAFKWVMSHMVYVTWLTYIAKYHISMRGIRRRRVQWCVVSLIANTNGSSHTFTRQDLLFRNVAQSCVKLLSHVSYERVMSHKNVFAPHGVMMSRVANTNGSRHTFTWTPACWIWSVISPISKLHPFSSSL